MSDAEFLFRIAIACFMVSALLAMACWVMKYQGKRLTNKDRLFQEALEAQSRNPMLPFVEYLHPNDLWFFQHRMAPTVLDEWQRSITSEYQPLGSVPEGIELTPTEVQEERQSLKGSMLDKTDTLVGHAIATDTHLKAQAAVESKKRKAEALQKRQAQQVADHRASIISANDGNGRASRIETLELKNGIKVRRHIPVEMDLEHAWNSGYLLACMRGFGDGNAAMTTDIKYMAIMATTKGAITLKALHRYMEYQYLHDWIPGNIPPGDDVSLYPNAQSLEALVKLYRHQHGLEGDFGVDHLLFE